MPSGGQNKMNIFFNTITRIAFFQLEDSNLKASILHNTTYFDSPLKLLLSVKHSFTPIFKDFVV